jgi:hypothetical protein
MSRNSHISSLQRLAAWIMLWHYLFSIFCLTLPPLARAQSSGQQPSQYYILYHKAQGKSWQQIRQEMAPDIASIEQYQQQLAQQYDLQLDEWLLLPDNGVQTRRYPGVTLVQMGEGEELVDIALHYRVSPQTLKELNSKVKRPEQLDALPGQWIIVPQTRDKKGDETQDDNNPLRDSAAAFWGSAQQSGAGDALRATASGAVNAALTQEVESWLNRTGGKARVTADVGIGGNDSRDVGLDYLWPIKIWQDDILFTQISAHRWNERNIVNVGLGWRHSFNEHLMAGGNIFFDQDITRHHNRMGLGGELWSDAIRVSANYYAPLSGWRHSDDDIFNDDPVRYELYERAARGWDLNLETALSQHISTKVGLFQWYGDKVDVNGSRSEASRDPYGLNLGLNWQPIPLVGINAEHSIISGQSNNFSVGLNFHWEFGRKLSEMLSPDNASALPSLTQSRTEFITRNNNIVLAYKQKKKDLRLYFSPTQKSTPAGVPMQHTVQGGQGGTIRYVSSSATVATIDAASGLVDPKQRGEVTITATETAPMDSSRVLSSASYHLTITPGDFAPSVTGVSIDGEMSPGSTLTGSYRYQNNEGEDEDPAGTLMRWYDKDSGELLQEGSATWQVQAEDMSKTLVFEVTPVNKKGAAGEPGSAEITGSASITSLRIDHLLTPGEIRTDGSVKFFARDSGSLLLLAEVKDGKGAPLADQRVYWQSQNGLGALSQNSVLTDSNGQALVKIQDIMAGGQDQIIASLSASTTVNNKADGDGDKQRKKMTLMVDFSQPVNVSFSAIPDRIEVATSQSFTINVTDQDGDPMTVPTAVTWSSNGVTYEGTTDTEGHASITLTAPEKVAEGWKVNAQVGDTDASAPSVTLVAGAVTRVELDVPDSQVAGSDDAQVSAQLFDRYDNPIINRSNAIDWRIVGSQFSGDASGDSDEQGRVSAKVKIPVVAPSVVEISAGDVTRNINVIVGTVDRVELSATPDTLTANGSDSSQLEAVAYDANNNLVRNATILWTLQTPELGALSQQSDDTGAQGKGTAIFTVSSLGGEAKVTADIQGKTDTVSLTLNGIPKVKSVALDRTTTLKVAETIRVADYQVEENGGGAVTMSWQWTRDGKLIDDAIGDSYKLKEADTGAQLAVIAWASNASGEKSSKTSASTDRVIGLVNSVAVTPSKNSVNADGKSELTFTALATDKNGVAVPAEQINWHVDKPDLVEMSPGSTTTDDQGKGELKLTTKNTGGEIHVSATIGEKTGGSDVALNGIPKITRVTLTKTTGLKVGDEIGIEHLDVSENGGGKASLSYRWGYDTGTVSGGIGNATGKTYVLKESDAGNRIYLYVEATNAAGNTAINYSDKTDRVIGLVNSVVVTSSESSVNADGKSELTFTALATDKNGVAVPAEQINWHVDKPDLVEMSPGSITTDDKGKGELKLTTKNTGGEIHVSATIGGKTGGSDVALNGIPKITRVTLTKTTGLKVGDEIGIEHLDVSENGGGKASLSYRWGYDTGTISGGIGNATGKTYVLKESDVGNRIYLYVEATNAAGNKAINQSDKTDRVIGSVTNVKVKASAESVEVDDAKSITFTAKATDRLGVAVPGESINWVIDNPSLVSVSTKDEITARDGTGEMVVLMTKSGGKIKVTATVAAQHGDDSVQLKGSPIVSHTSIVKDSVGGSSSALVVGDRLKASADVDQNGGGTATMSWQWLRDSTAISAPVASNSYTLQTADIGKRISVIAIATNASNKKGQQTSSSTGAVHSGVPVITAPVASGSKEVNKSLTAQYSFTANGTGTDASTYLWQWSADGRTGWKDSSGTSGYKERVFTPGNSYMGYWVRVKVTPKGRDSTRTGSEQISEPVQVYGAPVVSVPVISGIKEVNKPLTAEYSFTANGTGNNASTYRWQWSSDGKTGWKDSSETSDYQNRVFTPNDSYSGYWVRVKVTPKGSDKTLTGTEQVSAPVQIKVKEVIKPSVSGLGYTGDPSICRKGITASYTYHSNGGAGEGTSRFRWEWAGNVVSRTQYLPSVFWYNLKLYITPVNSDGVAGEEKSVEISLNSKCDYD